MAENPLAVEYHDVPHSLKCTKCSNVLKDPYVLGCDCRFCHACIDEMVATGFQFCSGLRTGCHETALSTASQDDNANTIISRLQVICPHSGCRQHYSLAELDEHLKHCPKRSLNCPFKHLGCDQIIVADQLGEHLLSSNCCYIDTLISQHNKIEEMRAVIDNQNQQIQMFGYMLDKQDGELKNLSAQVALADNVYTSIQNEMDLLRTPNMGLPAQVAQLTAKLSKEIAMRAEQDDRTAAKSIDYVDRKLTAINRLIGIEEDEFEMEQNFVEEDFKSRKNDIPSLNRGHKPIKEDILRLKSKINCIEAASQIDASWEWFIEEDVRDLNWDWKDKPIQHFYGSLCPYKFRLASWPHKRTHDSLSIHLRIYHSTKDEELPWPFWGTVTITVTDKMKPDSCLTVTKKCEIKKPLNDRYTFSENFVFTYVALIANGVNPSAGLRVLCAIITDTNRRSGLYSWLWGR